MKYRTGYKYVLHEDYEDQTLIKPGELIKNELITLFPHGLLQIRHGYAWDGASWAPDTIYFMTASLEHDAFAQLMREGLLDYKRWFTPVNRQLQARCVEKGMSVGEAWIVFMAVNYLSDKWARPGSDGGKPILEAP